MNELSDACEENEGFVFATPTVSTTNFLDLTDTPDSYMGQAGKMVVVNAAGTGLEFIDVPAGGGGEIPDVGSIRITSSGDTRVTTDGDTRTI